jgi:hypothetical protein
MIEDLVVRRRTKRHCCAAPQRHTTRGSTSRRLWIYCMRVSLCARCACRGSQATGASARTVASACEDDCFWQCRLAPVCCCAQTLALHEHFALQTAQASPGQNGVAQGTCCGHRAAALETCLHSICLALSPRSGTQDNNAEIFMSFELSIEHSGWVQAHRRIWSAPASCSATVQRGRRATQCLEIMFFVSVDRSWTAERRTSSTSRQDQGHSCLH